MDLDYFMKSFSNITPNAEQIARIEDIRSQYKFLLSSLCELPPSRERSLAITNLENSLMYAVKTIVMENA